MQREKEYSNVVSKEHLKQYGQFFTPHKIAKFMTRWACKSATSMLDLAVGNSIFLTEAKEINKFCQLRGYEIDTTILNFFGNPSGAFIENSDYLLSSWDLRFDAIVCNPPYNRFQALSNRAEILSMLFNKTGIKFSGYTNSYILFLAKSIFQMSEKGRLAYLIPSEFLNSKYGNEIKQILIEQQLLYGVINFSNDNELYENATTTNCILLLDRTPKDSVLFFNISSQEEIENITLDKNEENAISIPYKQLNPKDKWRRFLLQEDSCNYAHLIPFSTICSASRGIATGANDFFCFSKSKAKENDIPDNCLMPCICKSSDVKSLIFDEPHFQELVNLDKTVFVLNANFENANSINKYLEKGLEQNIDKKYLCSCRKPWFSMEPKETAPIWVTSASRGVMKFVRNTTKVKSLTTFHSIFVNPLYFEYTDILFCYFITPIAQEILKQNRKSLGNGLDKFQPNDLNTANILDVRVINDLDKERIMSIYKRIGTTDMDTIINELNSIFFGYLSS